MATMAAVAIMLSILVNGAANTLVVKALYSIWSTDARGNPMQFRRPWDATLAKFIGIAVAGLVGKVLLHVFVSLRSRKDCATCKGTSKPPRGSYAITVALAAAPAFLNVLSTGCLCAGLLYVPASVSLVLRSSGIVFTALFSMTLLGKEMPAFKWVGVGCCLLGITLASLANISTATVFEGSLTQSITGMALVITSQIFKALQVVIEEILIKTSKLPTIDIILWGGIWPLLIMLSVVYPVMYAFPGADHGHMHDPMSSVAMFSNSLEVSTLFLGACFTGGAITVSLTYATAFLSAMWRMLLEAGGTFLVWLFGLVVHYLVDSGSELGEAWSTWSYLELLGFLLVLLGQFIYGGFLQLPCGRTASRAGAGDPSDLEAAKVTTAEPSSQNSRREEGRLEEAAELERGARGGDQASSGAVSGDAC